MSFQTGPTTNKIQDWSKFDFTRWNLDNLNLDPNTATLSAWLRDVTVSPQGSQKFAAGLIAVKAGALQSFKEQLHGMQKRLSTIDDEMASRLSTGHRQIARLEETIRVAAAPSVAPPDAASFQVTTKVVDQSSRIGLPGLQVHLFDTKSPHQILASATTDQNGNAVLKLNREQIDAITKSGGSLATEVLTQNNKSVFSGGTVPPPRMGETGTLLTPITASDDVAPNLNAATAMLANQQALLTKASARLEDLQTHYQQMKADLQAQIKETQAIVTELEGTQGNSIAAIQSYPPNNETTR